MKSLSTLKSIFKNRNNTIGVRKDAFLEYTMRFYTLHNRSVNGGYCLYQGDPGCAIGQHMDKEKARIADGVDDEGYAHPMSIDEVVGNYMIPEWLDEYVKTNSNTMFGLDFAQRVKPIINHMEAQNA